MMLYCFYLTRMLSDNIITEVKEKAFGFGAVNESLKGGMKV